MKVKTVILCAFLVLALAASASAQKKKAPAGDYTKHPGYMEFDTKAIFGGAEPKVEVYLRQPMLNLVSKFAENEDPEMVEVLGKLQLVRVQIFNSDDESFQKFATESSAAVKALDSKGWERVVRVREDNEQVYVYLKPSPDYEFIQGIVVIAAEDDDDAIFVNIVGDIHPDDIDILGDRFGIDELDSIRYEVKKK